MAQALRSSQPSDSTVLTGGPVARASRRSLSRSAIAAYLCICVALVLLLALTVWESYRDMKFLRATLLEGEIDRLRSHAQRTVGRIEQDMEVRSAADLRELGQTGWLHEYWQRVIPKGERRLYAAVVSADGNVVLHSNPTHQRKRLPSDWYNRVLFDVGEDVFETRNSTLAMGKLAYDVRVPIVLDSREIGEYHAGFDVDWFEQWTEEKQSTFVRRRLLLISGVLLIVLLATTSLYYIASHSISLRRAVDSASLARATEVGKLAAGLAHEIRNPLHAIQLNLHSFRRVHEQKAELSPEETTKLLEQSTREIDRIEQLMQQLVGFATPDEPRDEVIDLTSEIREVAEFLEQEMLGKRIKLQTRLPNSAVTVRMDRGRLRQIMLNLLQNAQQAMEDGGSINIELSRRHARAEINVSDSGPGIPEEDRKRIFEPFYSTKPEGTGLGLALVKRFLDEVDGTIQVDSNPAGGVTFRIVVPESSEV